MSDGVLLPITEADTIHFCQNAEQFGDGSPVYLLPTKRPKWWLRDELPWMSRAELEETIQAALDEWSLVADVIATRADRLEDANFVITTDKIDGPGKVLADQQLPSPGLRQQRMRIDIAEEALKPLLKTILTHEFGHAFGMQHFPAGPPPELMEPALQPSITKPQPTEAALMAKWYGPPASTPTVPTEPGSPLVCTMRMADTDCTLKVTPGLDRVHCDIGVQKGGKKAALAGYKNW